MNPQQSNNTQTTLTSKMINMNLKHSESQKKN